MFNFYLCRWYEVCTKFDSNNSYKIYDRTIVDDLIGDIPFGCHDSSNYADVLSTMRSLCSSKIGCFFYDQYSVIIS